MANLSSFWVTRRSFLAAGLLFGAGCSRLPGWPARFSSQAEAIRESVSRGAGYLWSAQSSDGGWHSTTYGLLESGQSLTAFVLDALLQVSRDVFAPREDKVNRALAFLRRHIDDEGALGRADPLLPDYPNYSTSLAVLALVRAGRAEDRGLVERMVRYLRGQQFTEENGWEEEHPVYGAWGMGGDRRRPPHTGHVDLSMTRHVLQALAVAGVRAGDAAFRKAHIYLERCHNYRSGGDRPNDGGFYFSTVVLDANKAGASGEGFRSYGTATADGILSLLATGASASDGRVRAAERWLAAHDRPDGAPGFVGEAYQRWIPGLRYYYAAASSEAFRRLNKRKSAGLAAALIEEQFLDGHWSNPEDLVKEDDPLIATPFALRALLNEQAGCA